MISIIICFSFIFFLELWLILDFYFKNRELEESLKLAINKWKEVIKDKHCYKDYFKRSINLLKIEKKK
jgi:hypothetical protein